MCQCRCKQGDQGDTGPAGPTYTVSSVALVETPIVNSLVVTIIASIPTSGTLTFWGNATVLLSGAGTNMALTPGTTAGDVAALSSTLTVANTSFGTMAISGQIAVTAGQVFRITIGLGAVSGTLRSGNVSYNIQ